MVVILQRRNPLQLFPFLSMLYIVDKSACFTVQLLCCPTVQYMEVVNKCLKKKSKIGDEREKQTI